MKKSLASVFAFVILLFSVAANASQITASNAFGHPGDPVSLAVALSDGDISYGGDFTIGFDSTKLTFVDILGASAGFSPFFFSSAPGVELLSLAYIGQLPAPGPISPIFSILFSINSSYPSSVFPDVTVVDISGYFLDVDSNQVPLDQSIAPTVTVLAGTVPEPGVLGLVGLALLIMTGVGRRGRVNRG
ncbi:MAG: hypothetical protein Q8O52_15025 [Sulfuritalea sp.]|nr:hypothetical protein [Sulfuritalea sp.]